MIISSKRHNVVIEQINESFFCKEDQHLLTGMAAMGKRGIPSGCHGGGCGVCKVRIIEGEIETIVMSSEHISNADRLKGIVLACRTFPRGDIRLEVIGKLSKNILKQKSEKKYGFV